MRDLLDSPGMMAVFAVILALEGLSLLLLLLNIRVFRGQSEKYRLLLEGLGSRGEWGRPGRILVPVYALLTLGVTAVTTAVFLFQPHLL